MVTMKRYFIVKSGWENFDLSRAYGLGLILYALSSESPEVILSDKNYWYEINAPPTLKPDVKRLSAYLGEDLNWNETLTTTTLKEKNKIKMETRQFLASKPKIREILESYSKFKTIQIPYKGKEAKTLYGSMELRSFKGFREPIRMKTGYSEGGTPKVPLQDWIISIVGHINITIWEYGSNFNELLAVMPMPMYEGIRIADLYMEIRGGIKQDIKRMHWAGRFPTLAYIGVELTKSRAKLVEGTWEYSPRYASLLYGSMVRSRRKQWKPVVAGLFPLDFLHDIARSPQCVEILELWGDVFRKTNRKGCEDLAMTLSEFIADPTLSNLAKYINLHTRYLSTKKAWLNLYQDKIMREVMHNVRV